MTQTATLPTARKVPTRREALIFRSKTFLLQARRSCSNLFDRELRRFAPVAATSSLPVLAESRTQLWTNHDPEERALLAGKIQNLRLAVRRLNNIEVNAGEIFSFWKQVGRTTRLRGFVEGRELREGCIIPNIGGGLCQLSNALYDAALKANFEVVERHAHTQVVPGSLAEQGRDATVFWNYVDLRFRSEGAFRVKARLDGHDLVVQFQGEKSHEKEMHRIERRLVGEPINNCLSCETSDCRRMVKRDPGTRFGRTAFLVDDVWPEFDEYIQATKDARDHIFLPLDGKRFRRANYEWTTGGFSKIEQSIYLTAARSYRSRRLAAQGAARQLNLLDTYRTLAESYAKRLPFDALHIVVQQNLLPYLWINGDLGGRTFDVLMAALPMHEIQRRLDHAASLHPESTTLGDFRADQQLVDAEQEALKNARKIITPHSAIAELFDERVELLDWKSTGPIRRSQQQREKPVIVFPSSTVGRKGSYELREALRGLDVKLITLGPYIEGKDFWSGFDVVPGGGDWLERADAVVLPAFVEHKPRLLLSAASAGIPVIASSACGLDKVAGVSQINAGDAAGLRSGLEVILSRPN